MLPEYIKRAALVFISVIVTILIIEGLLRLGGWGFFYDQERQNTKPLLSKGKELVVLCIGESTTGMGRKHSWPSQLQRILNSIQDQRVFRVVNKGMPSEDTNTLLTDLPAHISKYKPDFVLAMVGINDGYLDGNGTIDNVAIFKHFESFPEKLLSGQSQLMTLLSHSRTYGLIKWITGGMKARIKKKTEDMTTASVVRESSGEKKLDVYGLRNPNVTHLYPKTVNNLNKIIDITAAKGINFVFVQYPLRKIDILKNVVKGNVFYVNNYEIFVELLKQHDYGDLFTDRFANDFGHATPFGNRIIADNVARQLIKILES